MEDFNKKPSIFRKFMWWLKDARYYHKDFISGVKNLYKWLPIIWKDRDWDHFFIYQIIEFKLRGQAKYIGTKDRHTRAKEDARDMLICANLIAKIKDGYYDGEYIKPYLELSVHHRNYPTLDHKYPRSKAFQDGLTPYEVTVKENLVWTKRTNNSKKGNKTLNV